MRLILLIAISLGIISCTYGTRNVAYNLSLHLKNKEDEIKLLDILKTYANDNKYEFRGGPSGDARLYFLVSLHDKNKKTVFSIINKRNKNGEFIPLSYSFAIYNGKNFDAKNTKKNLEEILKNKFPEAPSIE